MKTLLIVLSTLLIVAIIFFAATPVGRATWNNWFFNVQKAENAKNGIPNIGIGENTRIQKAIIDKDARIGKNCSIGFSPTPLEEGDHGSYYVSDGIIIIRKNAIIPDGTII